jgi:hypothetical protein
MTIEENLKNYILDRYDNIAEFSKRSGIPASTIFTAFKRGINNTSATTILKMCVALNIDANALGKGEIKEDKPNCAYDKKEILDIIQEISSKSSVITHRGKTLSQNQKEMIAYSTKVALETALKFIG